MTNSTINAKAARLCELNAATAKADECAAAAERDGRILAAGQIRWGAMAVRQERDLLQLLHDLSWGVTFDAPRH